jgi:hypothetical protein
MELGVDVSLLGAGGAAGSVCSLLELFPFRGVYGQKVKEGEEEEEEEGPGSLKSNVTSAPVSKR